MTHHIDTQISTGLTDMDTGNKGALHDCHELGRFIARCQLYQRNPTSSFHARQFKRPARTPRRFILRCTPFPVPEGRRPFLNGRQVGSGRQSSDSHQAALTKTFVEKCFQVLSAAETQVTLFGFEHMQLETVVFCHEFTAKTRNCARARTAPQRLHGQPLGRANSIWL